MRSTGTPAATPNPNNAPALAPTTRSIGMPASCSTAIAPAWAQPRTPPAPRTRPTRLPADEVEEEVDDATNKGCHWDCDDPGQDDIQADTPSYCSRLVCRACAEDRTGHHMRRTHRQSQLRCPFDDEGRDHLSVESFRRFNLVESGPHRADNPPATRIRSQRHGRGRSHDDPEGDGKGRQEVTCDQRQRNQSHRLLCVVGAVTEGDKRGR